MADRRILLHSVFPRVSGRLRESSSRSEKRDHTGENAACIQLHSPEACFFAVMVRISFCHVWQAMKNCR